MSKISVIVPCYNVESYIERCLQSLVNQTLQDIEIVCIDDKSTDNTLSIIKDFAKQDKRIRIVEHKKNSGAAVARNSGLDVATGEYIGFVDPDDYVDTDFYEKLYDCATKTSSPIAKANVTCIDSKTGITGEHWLNKYVKRDVLYFITTFWSAIYKRDFLIQNNIRFPDEIPVSQDAVFLTLVTLHAPSISVIDDTYYHYFYQRAGSLDSAMLSHRKAESKLNALKLNLEHIQNSNLPDNKKAFAVEQHCMRHALYEIKKEYEKTEDQEKFFMFLADLVEKYPETKYIRQNTSKRIYNSLKNKHFNLFKRYSALQRRRVYLFHFLPILNIDTIGSHTTYFLFDFIPLIRVFENRKWYLFGIIPLFKIKG
ncbi:MAG: glycosyltransferase [Alphaproteobacteria bacterium]|nr:glycosyltransferase [Alphaproteobacteria bacterium]